MQMAASCIAKMFLFIGASVKIELRYLNQDKYFNIIRKFSTDILSHDPMAGFYQHGN
jgi:hypothetical protein